MRSGFVEARNLMNRKARRAAKKTLLKNHGGALPIADLLDRARRYREQRQSNAVERTCEEILLYEPFNVQALNILGLTFQESGRHRLAVKAFEKSIVSDPLNAACHFNVANSYHALKRSDEAASHFKKAIILDDRPNKIETLILQNPVVMSCVGQINAGSPVHVKVKEIFVPPILNGIASDLFLRCALETKQICGVELEKFLTLLRAALLGLVHSDEIDASIVRIDLLNLATAMARQCFVNEFVYAESEREIEQSTCQRDALLQKLREGQEIPSLLLAVVGTYFPLHTLPEAHLLLHRRWSGSLNDLLHLQVREPLEEAADRNSVVSLTPVSDAVSLEVKHQYEESPYPRWTVDTATCAVGNDVACGSGGRDGPRASKILIAGCGTGLHAIEVALNNRASHILGIDISLASLCFARRRSREANVGNIEFAQADILNLGAIGRDFDRIEVVGVLHHLADPETGWRVLLSLLQPNGVMRVGLYSEIARSDIVSVRKFISERGYRPTSHDIRKCRQEIFREYRQRDWASIVGGSDFYCMSGCRDMLFNVMEHRFTIPRIKAFLGDQQLSFLGFDVQREILAKFQRQFPSTVDVLNLDKWHTFEIGNPNTFMQMYQFEVRKN
jgi:SAM-dependent methyltransferase/tetratricopeptide (TPR) repeat protein